MNEVLQETLRQAVLNKAPKILAHTIKWPSRIQVLKLNDGAGCCKIHLPKEAVISNMQEDATAFEGWALVIKAWLVNDGITSVELSWDDPGTSDDQNGHYQRFLYRVIRFIQMFDWFSVSDEQNKLLLKSRVLELDGTVKTGNFYLNTEGNRENNILEVRRKQKEFDEMTEHEAELLFISNNTSLLRSVFGSHEAELNRQLPVGVFDGPPSKKANCPIFSHGKSAIDLWATNSEKVALFELKKPVGNKRVGAISELFFYVNVVSDLQKGKFKVNADEKHEKFKGKKIEGYLLLGENNLHPLLSKEVFTEINNGLAKIDCTMGLISYGYCDETSAWCRNEYQG